MLNSLENENYILVDGGGSTSLTLVNTSAHAADKQCRVLYTSVLFFNTNSTVLFSPALCFSLTENQHQQ
jgi:hypothetical protein